jgi:hypothetical protein
VPDGWVVDDGRDVVEHKGTREAVVIGRDGCEDYQKKTEQRREARAVSRRLSRAPNGLPQP